MGRRRERERSRACACVCACGVGDAEWEDDSDRESRSPARLSTGLTGGVSKPGGEVAGGAAVVQARP